MEGEEISRGTQVVSKATKEKNNKFKEFMRNTFKPHLTKGARQGHSPEPHEDMGLNNVETGTEVDPVLEYQRQLLTAEEHKRRKGRRTHEPTVGE
jgi:hypothetical protein